MTFFAPMRQIRDSITEDKDTRALLRKNTTFLTQAPIKRSSESGRAFAPAGQSTQMIIGASPESDYQILTLSSALYQKLSLKRVFFSAYLPVNQDKRLPQTDGIALNREHRLYQADWLLRFYKFDVNELIDKEHPFLDTDVDPKANWALNHLEFFPVEVQKATLEELLRVPGIGPKGARLILQARKKHRLAENELKKLGIALKRARFFITCNGKYLGNDVSFTPEALKPQLITAQKGGNHGRRSAKVHPDQDRKSTRLNSSHSAKSRMPSSA